MNLWEICNRTGPSAGKYYLSFANKAGKEKIQDIELSIPIDEKRNFDIFKQKELSEKFKKFKKVFSINLIKYQTQKLTRAHISSNGTAAYFESIYAKAKKCLEFINYGGHAYRLFLDARFWPRGASVSELPPGKKSGLFFVVSPIFQK